MDLQAIAEEIAVAVNEVYSFALDTNRVAATVAILEKYR
jgi:hypothetical protein